MLYHWLDWGSFPYPGNNTIHRPEQLPSDLIDNLVPVSSSRPKRSLKSLYDETIELVPYTDILAWWLEQIATNPDMTVLMEKLGVRTDS